MKILETLTRKKQPLEVVIQIDEFTQFAEKAFDCEFTGKAQFYPWNAPTLIPETYNIGVI